MSPACSPSWLNVQKRHHHNWLRADVTNKLCWNKTLGLNVPSHMTIYNQSESIISALLSDAKYCLWHFNTKSSHEFKCYFSEIFMLDGLLYLLSVVWIAHVVEYAPYEQISKKFFTKYVRIQLGRLLGTLSLETSYLVR